MPRLVVATRGVWLRSIIPRAAGTGSSTFLLVGTRIRRKFGIGRARGGIDAAAALRRSHKRESEQVVTNLKNASLMQRVWGGCTDLVS